MSATNRLSTRLLACVVAVAISNVASIATAHAALISTAQVAQVAANQDRVSIGTIK
jgi:hypothetical protein